MCERRHLFYIRIILNPNRKGGSLAITDNTSKELVTYSATSFDKKGEKWREHSDQCRHPQEANSDVQAQVGV